MGIPYSKQINAAFDQVTPLVAEGFEVLQTTRNITFLLAEIQVLTVILLFLILIALAMLLITTNPDLERERQALITPVLRWSASWIMSSEGKRRFGFVGVLVLSGGIGIVYLHWWAYFRNKNGEEAMPPEDQVAQAEEKDVDAVKRMAR